MRSKEKVIRDSENEYRSMRYTFEERLLHASGINAGEAEA
jgi:hypothetical protein